MKWYSTTTSNNRRRNNKNNTAFTKKERKMTFVTFSRENTSRKHFEKTSRVSLTVRDGQQQRHACSRDQDLGRGDGRGQGEGRHR